MSDYVSRMLEIQAEHERAEREDQQSEFRWDLLLDAGGLPAHLPIGVTAAGEGPTSDNEAHHYVCWCADAKCLVARALRDAWLSGMRHGLTAPTTNPAAAATRAELTVTTEEPA